MIISLNQKNKKDIDSFCKINVFCKPNRQWGI